MNRFHVHVHVADLEANIRFYSQLLAAVVGSGIMGEALAQGNLAVALLANAAATAGVLYVLITILGPLSGAHFNPAVSLVAFARGELSGADTTAYLLAQFTGAIVGVLLAHLMFIDVICESGSDRRARPDRFVFRHSRHRRTGVHRVASRWCRCGGALCTHAARPARTIALKKRRLRACAVLLLGGRDEGDGAGVLGRKATQDARRRARERSAAGSYDALPLE